MLAWTAAGAKVEWDKERAQFDATLAARPEDDANLRLIRELGLVA